MEDDFKKDKPQIFVSKYPLPLLFHLMVIANIWIALGVIDENQVLLNHAFIQTGLFILVAHIPSFLTGVMWWVDLAWPLGLMTIGIYNYIYSQDTLKAKLICLCVFLQGLRMALGATFCILSGKWKTKRDLPRYQYQKILHEHHSGPGTFGTIHMQKEIYMQAIANYAVLTVPIYIVCRDKQEIQSVEILGFTMWILSLLFESVADNQKLKFALNKNNPRDAICDVGLWKYSRHPNYFGEWMVWNSLILVAIPSLINRQSSLQEKLQIAFAFFSVSASMYYCLSIWTGAVPAEYFSV